MPLKVMMALSIFLATTVPGCEDCRDSLPVSPSSISVSNPAENKGETVNPISEAMEVASNLFGSQTTAVSPSLIHGVELTTLRGWWAAIYPWVYLPEQSSVHPMPRLWTSHQTPSPFQMAEQCRQIKKFGGAAVVLEYQPDPTNGDHNYWLSNGFASGCGPFFLLYEHIYGTRFIPSNNGPKDMNDSYNRKVFKDDIDFMFKNVVVPYRSRYVTVNGRAVIYMWASSQMTGNFASLLEEVKKEYPVFFIGSGGEVWATPKGEDLARVKALDGFMEYTLGGGSNYLQTVRGYNRSSFFWRNYLRKLESETGKRYLFIPTFQAAYDDTVVRGRTNPPMYARSRDEVKYHAEMIRSSMGSVYDGPGPFVVYSELPEGAAVIESQCLPTTIDTSGRFVGCGTARLEILKEYFGW